MSVWNPELQALYDDAVRCKDTMLRMSSHTNIIPDGCKHRKAYLKSKSIYEEALRKANDNAKVQEKES